MDHDWITIVIVLVYSNNYSNKLIVISETLHILVTK